MPFYSEYNYWLIYFLTGYKVTNKDILIIASMNNALKQVQYKNSVANNLKTYETAFKAAGYKSKHDKIDPQRIHELMVCPILYILLFQLLIYFYYRIPYGWNMGHLSQMHRLWNCMAFTQASLMKTWTSWRIWSPCWMMRMERIHARWPTLLIPGSKLLPQKLRYILTFISVNTNILLTECSPGVNVQLQVSK